LQKYHPALSRWLEFLNRTAENFIRKSSRFGDWCAADNSTPPEFVATAFYARAAKMLADIAGILGEKELQREREVLFHNICHAFVNKFTENGHLTVKNQSAPIFALSFDLLPESFRPAVLQDLLYDIEIKREYSISTGFLTTGLLLDLLSRYNCHDTAGKILLRRECPSLLYPVLKGATSIWEHWDGIREDGTFADPKMNSFNHYALGSFCSWFYEYLGGIQAAEPGFGKVRFAPCPIRQLDHVKAEFRGIKTFWEWRGNELYWEITTPVEAELVLPDVVKKVAPGHYSGVNKWYINS
jgi:alpha-L-rhamnosidase